LSRETQQFARAIIKNKKKNRVPLQTPCDITIGTVTFLLLFFFALSEDKLQEAKVPFAGDKFSVHNNVIK